MTDDIYQHRAEFSRSQLELLQAEFEGLSECKKFDNLTIYATGSFARLEASGHSDIDVFFINVGSEKDVEDPKTSSLRMFGKVIEIAERLGFDSFSNDSEYLRLLHLDEILSKLGSRIDDHQNYFTARMLLLLESYCIYGKDKFDELVRLIVASYFRDFKDHQQSFEPRFLMNDLTRFWKTMLLNYENKRRVLAELDSQKGLTPDIELQRTKQKVRNYKLKYSRMTTCFATIAALGSHRSPVREEDVIELVRLTPRERLLSITTRLPDTTEVVSDLIIKYAGFLQMTGLSMEDLEAQIADKTRRIELFTAANEYGDTMFELLKIIDGADPDLKLLRTVVI